MTSSPEQPEHEETRRLEVALAASDKLRYELERRYREQATALAKAEQERQEDYEDAFKAGEEHGANEARVEVERELERLREAAEECIQVRRHWTECRKLRELLSTDTQREDEGHFVSHERALAGEGCNRCGLAMEFWDKYPNCKALKANDER